MESDTPAIILPLTPCIATICTIKHHPYIQTRSIEASHVCTNLLGFLSHPKLLSPILPEFLEPTQLTPQEPANCRAHRQCTSYDHKSPDAGAVADFGHVHAENRRRRIDRDEDECKNSYCNMSAVSQDVERDQNGLTLTCDCVFAFSDCKPCLLMLVYLSLRVDADLYLFRDRFGFAQQPLQNVRSFVAFRVPGGWVTSAESRNLVDTDL
jgi:hypothetical protein